MRIVFIAAFIIANASSQDALNHYIELGLSQNPDVQVAYHRWQASLADVSVAKKLPNPMVSTGFYVENVETAVGPQEYRIGLMQSFPMIGKLRTVGLSKAFYAHAREQDYLQVKASIIAKIKSLYYEMVFLQKAIDIKRQNVHLLEYWEKVIQTKYETAQVGYSDLIKTQIELLKLRHDLESLRAKKQPLLQAFRTLLNDHAIEDAILPDTLQVEYINDSNEYLMQKILNNNHALNGSDHMIRMNDYALKRAKLNYWPDLGLGLDYILTGTKAIDGIPVTNSGKDPLVVKMSLNLPIWFGKTAKQVSAARYRKNAAEQYWISQQNRIKEEVEAIFHKLDDAKRRVELYKLNLIPKSNEALSASQKAYISGKADLITFIDAQRQLLQFNLEYEEAVVDYLKQKALLKSYMGSEEGE